jgi:beta-glucanase (GH16 family)
MNIALSGAGSIGLADAPSQRVPLARALIIVIMLALPLKSNSDEIDLAQMDVVIDERFDLLMPDPAIWIRQKGSNPHTMCSHSPDNISCAGGACKLSVTRDVMEQNKWRCGSMISKRDYLYGYYEIEMRYAESPGINNSFWLRNIRNSQGRFCEIDINEGHFPNEINTNVHTHLPSLKTRPVRLVSKDLVGRPHRYGVLWRRETISWYVDRKLVRTMNNTFCHMPLRVRVSTAITPWAGDIEKTISGQSMTVYSILVMQDKE